MRALAGAAVSRRLDWGRYTRIQDGTFLWPCEASVPRRAAVSTSCSSVLATWQLVPGVARGSCGAFYSQGPEVTVIYVMS